MDVAQFLDALGLGPDIEVIEATFPDAMCGRAARRNALMHYPASEAEFDSLDYGGGGALLRLGDQQVIVFRQDYVAQHHVVITNADLFKDCQEQISVLRSAKPRLTVITAEGIEVKVVGTVITMETTWHEGIVAST